MKKGVFLVQTQPQPGRDEEYNDWYDNEHLDQVLAHDAFKGARRFRLTEITAEINRPKEWSQYLVIYEVEADDLAAAHADLVAMLERDGTRVGSAVQYPVAQQLYEEISRRGSLAS